MKKLFFFIAFALILTICSCTPDEYETPKKQETEKKVTPLKTTYADGPGDGNGGATTPPATDD
ncbi:membrane lipoprotein lipid attachment site-containing protein [Flavobacterium chilense]|uniref:Lipoprotein n=1 Tax=Flavobacterium chilense TaxID=946677 RepID=A0A1M7JSZ4_9FLAO|nr:membrane lipoprotein lipid attachment site-containing protein [Flavobacterium chilense]SHM56152.1 hypothetical protein SAMN05444484_10736 [Flavobacterium chilense]